MKVAVIGKGVIGLATALFLKEKGVKVHLFYSPDRTRTSESAAAFWYPFAVDTTVDEEMELAFPTLQFYRERPVSAVRIIRAHQYFDDSAGAMARTKTWWMKSKEYGVNFRKISKRNLPKLDDEIGPIVEGWGFDIPVIAVRPFLMWMEDRLREGSNPVEFCNETVPKFDSLDDLQFDAIVNCAGIWATHLANDGRLTGKQGVVIDAPPTYSTNRLTFLEHGKSAARPVYVVPHEDHCVLGGTIEPVMPNGAKLIEGDPHPWAPREIDLRRILERCRLVEPKLRDWNPSLEELKRRARAAPRPVRDGVAPRVAFDGNMHGRTIIHNYGHGGSGYTMFWGSAQRVWALLTGKQVSNKQPLIS